MSRIRSVKPEYFTHPKVQACSVSARLMFIALWTEADDEGRLHDQPKRLAAVAFGEVDVPNGDELLHELEEHGLLLRYIKRRWPLIQIHDWPDHQRISHPTPSKLPAPGRLSLRRSSGKTPEKFRKDSGVTVETLREGSAPDLGKERKGKEQGKETPRTALRSERDPLRVEIKNALVALCGWEPTTMTRDTWGRVENAAKQLQDVGAEPDLMRGFASLWAQKYPGAALTPQAFTGNWADYMAGKLWPELRARR